MSRQIQILDCTLRDGAYIVDSDFGTPAIKGIIKKVQEARVDIIECGWLKDTPHQSGSTFFHVPSDLEAYLPDKSPQTQYVAMIDWNRYDLSALPVRDGKSIDAIRVVFPQDKFREGIALGTVIRTKGYQVYFQAANTLAYSDEELIALAHEVNSAHPVGLSVVDTFGAMYGEDLEHIVRILDRELDRDIRLGFHSHNNQQLSFALSMQFVEMLQESGREIIVDSSLCGMGRGAGNATTELVANFLNRKYRGNYDMDSIMDAIDMYMEQFSEKFRWGYSTPYFIAGMYCAHVNNIAYLLKNHRTTAQAMRNIIESLSVSERRQYDYDLLEQTYLNYQNKQVDDEKGLEQLKAEFADREILLLFPGKSSVKHKPEIDAYIQKNNPVVIGVNAVLDAYHYDFLFFSNEVRYNYAKDAYPQLFEKYKRIVASNIKTTAAEYETLVNFNLLVKRGWEHFDNSGIMCLRLLNKLQVAKVALAGFDGFSDNYADSYADVSLPRINPGKKWEELNDEIREMFQDLKKTTSHSMTIIFVTESRFA